MRPALPLVNMPLQSTLWGLGIDSTCLANIGWNGTSPPKPCGNPWDPCQEPDATSDDLIEQWTPVHPRLEERRT